MFALGALAVILALAYWDWRQFVTANERVRETDQSLRQIQTILSTMERAETGQRGFLITGEEIYLKPYTEARQQIQKDLADAGAVRLRETALRDSLRQTPDGDRGEIQ